MKNKTIKTKINRLLAVTFGMMVLVSSNVTTQAAPSDLGASKTGKSEVENTEIIEKPGYVEELTQKLVSVEPIENISVDGKNYDFVYDDFNRLIEEKSRDSHIVFWYDGQDISKISCPEYDLEFVYTNYYGQNRCEKLVYQKKFFYLKYDNIGNVSEIYDEQGRKVSEYHYINGNPLPQVINYNDCIIGEINPFRYQGWFWDNETCYYYLGEGIFYDPISETFIQNEYKITEYGKKWLEQNTGSKSMGYNEIRFIENTYNAAMSSSGYGASSYSEVTQSQWNNGYRWYDGVSDLEVVARCIWAECTYSSRTNDRIGITAAIMNRKISGNVSARSVVTSPSQFYTVNPPYASLWQNAQTRTAKSKTNVPWQQATMLACVAIYANNTSDIGYFYTIPAGITTQKNFRALDSVSRDYNNGNIKIAGVVRHDIAIAGYGTITTLNDYQYLDNLANQHYTIFFND